MNIVAVTGRSRSYKRNALIGAAMVLAGALAGCGSSAESAGSSVDAASVAEAKSFLEPYLERPTSIALKTPITKPIPRDKTVAYINCGSPNCVHDIDLAKDATEFLGWKLDVINTDGTPAETSNAWAQILRSKPDGVMYTATPRTQIDSYLKKAAAEGITVVANSTPDPAVDGLEYVVNGSASFEDIGPVLAAWAIANGGAKPSVLFLNMPNFPVLNVIEKGFNSSFNNWCGGCPTHTMDIPLSSIGKNVTDLVVSYLRSNPHVNVIVASTDSLFIGVPSALRLAGLGSIKTVGQGPTSTNVQYLKDGQQTASIAIKDYDDIYGMVDALARRFAGEPYPPEYGMPQWLVTQETLPETDAEGFFPANPNVVQDYQKLWTQ